ncbi:MAG: hypothetical protein E6J34_03250 [Chloroflexi bacterium]|nr:MAG: hypothetical protein E6J34_03250 [Chloroflexota bacterium]
MTTPNSHTFNVHLQQLQGLLRLGLAVVTELWFHTTDDWVTSVHAGDIDGDGDLEVLIGSRDGSVTALTSKKGAVKWRETEQQEEWIGTVYCIDNVRAADRTRVVIGSRNNKVIALDETGKRLWLYNTGQVVRRVRVLDVNGDGKLEVIVGSEDFCVHALSCDTGELLWKYPTNGWIRAVYSIDLDGDGELETLATSGDKYLYVLDSNGKLKWRRYIGSKVHSLFAIDLDKDGEIEILIGSDAKDLCALTPDGQKKWEFEPENRIHSINVADLNNDGRLEVIAASEDEHIYFLDDHGNLLWKHFLGHRIFSIFTTDLDKDGISEVLVGAEDNNVHVLRVELLDDLLPKILEAHAKVGSLHSTILPLSSTEALLLSDLTEENVVHEPNIPNASFSHLLQQQEYLEALSELLYLQQQRVQLLWMRTDLGHVRTVALNIKTEGPEMELVIGTDEGLVKGLNHRGEELWQANFSERIRTLQVADVDQDGTVEVVVGVVDGHAYALSDNGQKQKWKYDFGDWIESICTIDPDTMDDVAEIVFCTRDNKIHVYAGDFSPVVSPITTPQGIQIVRAYDLDNDGEEEIIAGALDDKVYVYKRNGDQLWSYRTLDRVKSLFIKDIDGDGRVEVLVGSEDRYIHVLDNTGRLKWRYYTPHRVLDIDAVDFDKDGKLEVFVGVGNSILYVLNYEGDLIWQFKANDRIRVVRIADIDGDGTTELVIGTEDRLYVLRRLDEHNVQEYIDQCWLDLLEFQSADEILTEMAQHSDARLRAFALKKLLTVSDLALDRTALLLQMRKDSSDEVKKAFAQSIVQLYQLNPQHIRSIIEMLATDPQREIRLALINSFPSLATHNPGLVFEYLERFSRNIDIWIRRTVVRKLDELAPFFQQEVFKLLLKIMRKDDTSWIRLEAARALAHYLGHHTDNLLRGVRVLCLLVSSITRKPDSSSKDWSTKDLSPTIFESIISCSTHVLVQNVFRVFSALFFDLSEANVLDKLEDAVAVLVQTRALHCGETMYSIYHEFYRLHRMRTIEEIAQYRCVLGNLCLLDEDQGTRFAETIKAFYQLNEVANVLRTYLRRLGLGDRISSLVETITAIDILLADMNENFYREHRREFPDYRALRLLLIRWRCIVLSELARQRGRAELRPELQTKRVAQEETVGILLSIHNHGRSPADHVSVELLQPTDHESTFTIVGSSIWHFETISTNEPVSTEFIIRPRKASVRLSFRIVYDDAEEQRKSFDFADRLDMVEMRREFTHMTNPYHTGTPIQDQNMFYGREREIALLREDFVYSTANTIIVLHGQRRSGKSSVLFHLLRTSILEPHIPIRIDMQHETLNFSIHRFLLHIAYYIQSALAERRIMVSVPERALFNEDPTFALDCFLDNVGAVLGDRKLVLLIDEFEILEEKVTKNELDRSIFDYLRSLIQHRHFMHFMFAGTHTIKELTAEYRSVFFNIANQRQLSRLSSEAARQLIIGPVRGMMEYDPYAVDKIRHLTGDQPYLIQLICHSIVRYCNTQRKHYVTINDVNIVQDEVMASGNMYFNWIWEWAAHHERIILAIVAQESGEHGRYVSLSDIERACQEYALPYKRDSIVQALRKLQDGDVIEEVPRENRFRIPVGLTRIWLRETKSLQNVVLEMGVQLHSHRITPS